MPADLGLAAELEQVRAQRDALLAAAEAAERALIAVTPKGYMDVATGSGGILNDLRAAIQQARGGTA